MWIAILCFLIYICILIIARKISKMEKFKKGFKISDTEMKKITKWNSFSWLKILESIFFATLLTWIDSEFENIIFSFFFYFVMYCLGSIISQLVFEFLDKKRVFKK